MENVLDIEKISSEIEEELKQSIKGCIIRPSVAVIEVGDNECSDKYIKEKEDACNRIGVYFRHYKFEEDTPELTIINKIKELNNDDYVNGIIIQLPLPKRYNEKRLLNTVINSKDIDGITDINIGRFISGRKTIVPCGVLAVSEIFKQNDIKLEGKDVVVVGKGKLMGRPLVNYLINEGATVTVCHSKTVDLKRHTMEADIVISAAGVKSIIKEDMIKEGAIVIDMGRTLDSGKVYGDVDFNRVSKKVSLITPKDGLSNLVVTMFLKNTLLCYNNKK